MNAIHWMPKAAKQLRKLPTVDQVTIRDAVGDQLAVFPDCTGVKRLTDHIYPYRLRVGRYRVFFAFDGIIRLISIEEVKKRDDHTY